MSAQENKSVVRRFYEAWNEEKLDETFELVAPGYINHGGSPETQGREGFKRLIAMYEQSFSRILHSIEDLLATEEEKIISRVTITGVHIGPFMGKPAIGKEFVISAINILHIEDSMLAEHWEVSDQLALVQQLGIISVPEPVVE